MSFYLNPIQSITKHNHFHMESVDYAKIISEAVTTLKLLITLSLSVFGNEVHRGSAAHACEHRDTGNTHVRCLSVSVAFSIPHECRIQGEPNGSCKTPSEYNVSVLRLQLSKPGAGETGAVGFGRVG